MTKDSKKQLTLADLQKIAGGRIATVGTIGTVRSGGRGSINGRRVEFPVDEA